MLFLLGVAMAILGVALCLLGEIKLPGGRVLKPLHAQICGAIFLCYFPLVFLLQRFTGEWELQWRLLACWVLAGLCWGVVLVIVLRTTAPAKPARRKIAAPARQPLFSNGESGAAVEEPEPDFSAGKKKNPFDFS